MIRLGEALGLSPARFELATIIFVVGFGLMCAVGIVAVLFVSSRASRTSQKERTRWWQLTR